MEVIGPVPFRPTLFDAAQALNGLRSAFFEREDDGFGEEYAAVFRGVGYGESERLGGFAVAAMGGEEEGGLLDELRACAAP